MSHSDFDVPLTTPLALKSGRVLWSLADGVDLIADLPEFPYLRPVWHLACAAILRAAQPGRTSGDIEAASHELELALRHDQLLKAVLPSDTPRG